MRYDAEAAICDRGVKMPVFESRLLFPRRKYDNLR